MAMLNNQMVYTYGVWKKSCTTKRMVETLEIMGFFMDFYHRFLLVQDFATIHSRGRDVGFNYLLTFLI